MFVSVLPAPPVVNRDYTCTDRLISPALSLMPYLQAPVLERWLRSCLPWLPGVVTAHEEPTVLLSVCVWPLEPFDSVLNNVTGPEEASEEGGGMSVYRFTPVCQST